MINRTLIISFGVAALIGAASVPALADGTSDELSKLESLDAEQLDSERGGIFVPNVKTDPNDPDSSDNDSSEAVSETLIVLGTGDKEQATAAVGAFIEYKADNIRGQLTGVGDKLNGLGNHLKSGLGTAGAQLKGGLGFHGLPTSSQPN